MIDLRAISDLIAEWGAPTVLDNYVIVPTFSTYPSNSLVQAFVDGGKDRFVVSDGGGASKVLLGSGSLSRSGQKLLADFIRGTSLKVSDSGWIYMSGVSFGGLTSAISLVTETSRDAAIVLLRHFRPVSVQDFRRDVEIALDRHFRDAVQKKGHLPGASNKLHLFDYLVRVNDNTLLALDAVLPDPSSINAAVVAHLDVKATHRSDVRQLIVYDDEEDWKAADLALLTIGAPSARFSSFLDALEALVA